MHRLVSGRTLISLPSAKAARYAGSSRTIGNRSSSREPAAPTTSASSPGMVITVGPVSKVKPSRTIRPARPPGIVSRSTTTTS